MFLNSDLLMPFCNSTIIDSSTTLATSSSRLIISESGANSTFFQIPDSSCLVKVQPTINIISAALSDDTVLSSTHEAYLLQ